MKFRNFSIKWQFIVVITLVAMPFFLLSLYNLGEEKKSKSEQAKALAISIARNIGLQQKSTEASTRQMLSLVSKLPQLQEEKPDSIMLNSLFKNILAENPQFAIVLAALPDGNAYASAIPFKPFSISDRKYFKDVLRTRSFAVGEFAKSRITNRAVLHYALPALNEKGNVKLILIASFDLSQYQNILSVSSLPKGSDFSFYDYSGRLLFNSQNQQKLIGKRGSNDIQKAMLAVTDEGAYISEREDGMKRLYGFVRINIEKDSPYMYIVISTPLSEAFRGAQLVFYRNIILILLAVLFSILISIYYKNYFFKNIDKLVKVANKFKDGDFTARTQMDYSAAEIGTLASALDKMAESLLSRELEKDSAHKNLKTLKERFEVAVNSARIGVWEWDLYTQKVFWDTQMFELYQTEPNCFKGTIPDWMKFLHPNDSERFEDELHHAVRYKKNHKTSFRILNSQKGYKNIRCYFNVIADANGKAMKITGINRDISERVLLENELIGLKENCEEKIKDLKNEIKAVLTALNEKADQLIIDTEKTKSIPLKEELERFRLQINSYRKYISKEIEDISKE